jgi:hypothetical protein
VVPAVGLEPTRLATGDFESPMYTNFITLAFLLYNFKIYAIRAKDFESPMYTNFITQAKTLRYI